MLLLITPANIRLCAVCQQALSTPYFLVFGLRLQFLILFTKCELLLNDWFIIIEGKRFLSVNSVSSKLVLQVISVASLTQM